jgi:hypothetical protein
MLCYVIACAVTKRLGFRVGVTHRHCTQRAASRPAAYVYVHVSYMYTCSIASSWRACNGVRVRVCTCACFLVQDLSARRDGEALNVTRARKFEVLYLLTPRQLTV